MSYHVVAVYRLHPQDVAQQVRRSAEIESFLAAQPGFQAYRITSGAEVVIVEHQWATADDRAAARVEQHRTFADEMDQRRAAVLHLSRTGYEGDAVVSVGSPDGFTPPEVRTVAVFDLKAGEADEQLRRAGTVAEFLADQPGFRAYRAIKTSDDQVVVVHEWQSQQAASAADARHQDDVAERKAAGSYRPLPVIETGRVGYSGSANDSLPRSAMPPHGSSATVPRTDSPRLATLQAAVAAGETVAVESFWAEAAASGTPMTEDDADPTHRIHTFLARSERDVSPIAMINGVVSPADPEAGRLRRVPGTDVYALSLRMPVGWVAGYGLVGEIPAGAIDSRQLLGAAVVDPLNPRRFGGGQGQPPKSIVGAGSIDSGSSAGDEDRATGGTDAESRSPYPAGAVSRHEVSCPTTGTRMVWVYRPADEVAPEAVLVALDGDLWVDSLGLPATLDRLIATGAIPPTVAVLPDAGGRVARASDLTCNRRFIDYLADDLLPWVAETGPVSDDPRRTLITGASFGGLASCFAGLTRPERFGMVLSQSGSFWYPNSAEPELLTRLFAEQPRQDLRLHLQHGTFETPNVGPTQRFCEMLAGKGYEFTSEQFIGGHDRAWWREAIVPGLVGTLGRL